jgi:tRNA dimethylallyltransferase
VSRQVELPPVVLLMGPTATGKTALAVELHQTLGLDVVSVDSAMVYRGMDIGTAKPDAALLRRCPHRLIDICDPADAYSTGRFVADAVREVAEIHAGGRIPLLAGGTMLYFRALQRGLADLPQADTALRAEIDEEAGRHGWPAMHERLRRVDPEAAARIEPRDSQRIQRALEVFRLSGEPLSRLQAAAAGTAPRWRFVKLALWPRDRTELAGRIAARFGQMLEAGLVAEVEKLRARPDIYPGLPSMRAVGYRQIFDFLEGRHDLAEAERRAIVATRQLAKRQLTWLRAEEGLVTLEAGQDPEAAAVAAIRLKVAQLS